MTDTERRRWNPNGLYCLILGAVGGGCGAAWASFDGPFRSSTLCALGGGTLGLLGGAMEDEEEGFAVIGAFTGGYIGGLLGGFLGGTSAKALHCIVRPASSVVLGATGLVVGNKYLGFSGAVCASIVGVLLGYFIGRPVIYPAATVLVCGFLGATGAGLGSYLGSTDLIGRPRPR